MILRDLGQDETLCRVLTPRWSHAPTSGSGAAVKGGRFNRPGLEALDLSQTMETALAEYQQHARLLPPGMLVTFLVSRVQVVDFSAGYEASRWNPLWAEYACHWRQLAFEEKVEPASWALGDMALEANAAGSLFPSTTHVGGINLVLFHSSALAPDALRVHDPNGDLPGDAQSWQV
jgi:RES domain-containing protein